MLTLTEKVLTALVGLSEELIVLLRVLSEDPPPHEIRNAVSTKGMRLGNEQAKYFLKNSFRDSLKF